MEPIQAMYDGDLAPLMEWVESGSKEHVPEPFFSWLRSHMPPNCREFIINRVGEISEETNVNGDWVVGYPHAHTITMGWNPEIFTIITYLVVPEEGGEFALGGLNLDDPYETIPVKPGLSIGCDSITWHGVRPVRRGNRIAIVSAGFPSEEAFLAGKKV